MSLVLLVTYCLVAAAFIFGITFHDERLREKRRPMSGGDKVVPIDRPRPGGRLRRRA